MLSAFAPRALINGHEVRLAWGDNVLPAPLGRHTIEVWVPYLWKFGKAEITVDNTQGAPQVYYAAPVLNFIRGAIGTSPVKPPGMVGMWIVYGVIAAVIVVCCAGAILNGGGNPS